MNHCEHWHKPYDWYISPVDGNPHLLVQIDQVVDYQATAPLGTTGCLLYGWTFPQSGLFDVAITGGTSPSLGIPVQLLPRATDALWTSGGNPPRVRRCGSREGRDPGCLNLVWPDHLIAGIRFGLRMVANTPRFTAVAALTLALGIGANTYIVSVVDALLLRPIEFPDPARHVVLFWETFAGHRSLTETNSRPRTSSI
jgi:hypothetical protein